MEKTLRHLAPTGGVGGGASARGAGHASAPPPSEAAQRLGGEVSGVRAMVRALEASHAARAAEEGPRGTAQHAAAPIDSEEERDDYFSDDG